MKKDWSNIGVSSGTGSGGERMRLSDLVTGQEAWIYEVTGDGEFRDRIHEMGFIGGRKVKAVKSAPLKDPVEYDVMGYKLTIRRKDAGMVIVEPHEPNPEDILSIRMSHRFPDDLSANTPGKELSVQNKTFTIALVGNPNCGKTTIFNYATHSRERVANYSGVTVAAKEAFLHLDGYKIRVIDLPGTYSLKPYSPEEMYVYDYLVNHTPDLVINVVDAGNPERNLFLTTQLIDMGIRTVVALNMADELKKSKATLDYRTLGDMLGFPIIPTVGHKGKGVRQLFRTAVEVYKGRIPGTRGAVIRYPDEIEQAIGNIREKLRIFGYKDVAAGRFVALRLLEGTFPEPDIELRNWAETIRTRIEKRTGEKISDAIVNTRYGYILGALTETYSKEQSTEKPSVSQLIDRYLTHKYLGLPIFFGIIFLIFYATFRLGEYPMAGIEWLFAKASEGVSALLPDSPFSALITDGVLGGVGGVMVFLPNIMILFFLISLLEDSGYMARTAFLMDRVMHKVGLHGKSFIPLLMGFGCNIPAVMATRTIESRRDRIVTMFVVPFMSCSARLPVYVLFISAFFPAWQSLILFGIYATGILAALITALILNKTVFKKEVAPFVMELPPYRMPVLKSVFRHTWFKTTHFLKKMGTVILLASVVIWILGYFPRDKEIINQYETAVSQISATGMEHEELALRKAELLNARDARLLEQSWISRIGKALEPVFRPLGFDWRMSVSVLTGVLAKEVVVSSMGVLYQAGGDDGSEATLIGRLRHEREQSGKPLIAYLSFLVFVLLYFPCLGTLTAIKRETSGFRWMLFAAGYPLLFAWSVAFLIYQAGILLF
ncbi:MAG: ferrous iron transport protein B [Bacteroidales bacterium]